MSKPVVVSYCTTFLKPEMLHIYRQVAGLRRYETTVVTKERQSEDRYPFDRVVALPKPRSNFIRRFYLKYIRRVPQIFYRGEFQVLRAALAGARPDLMHIYFGHTGVHLLPFIKVWEKPCIVSFHGADVMPREHDPSYVMRMHELLQTVPLVLARSRSLWHRLEALGCPESKLRLNRTGIPLDEFPYVERPVPDGNWHCVQACRLIPKKGLRVALDAFAHFRKHYPGAHFSIAGDGPMRAELEQKIAEMRLEDAVTMTGFLSQADLRDLYRRAHIFLHPSQLTEDENQEGIPNSMLEAMSTGMPVVSTLHGGIPEAVRADKDGLLVAERDVKATAEALCHLVEIPARWDSMGRSASERVREQFEQKRQIEKLEDCYDEARELGGAVA